MNTILATAKTWAALVGALLTALIGSLTPEDPGYRALTIALALVTAFAVWRIPNVDPEARFQDESVQPPDRGAIDAVTALVVAILAVILVYLVLRLFG